MDNFIHTYPVYAHAHHECYKFSKLISMGTIPICTGVPYEVRYGVPFGGPNGVPLGRLDEASYEGSNEVCTYCK